MAAAIATIISRDLSSGDQAVADLLAAFYDRPRPTSPLPAAIMSATAMASTISNRDLRPLRRNQKRRPWLTPPPH
jgi:hypothetical protein